MRWTAVAAVACAFGAGPVIAAGYVGAVYNFQETQFGPFTSESDQWQAEGAFGFLDGNFGGQVDAGIGSDAESEFWSLSGHAYWAGEGWRLGVVLSNTQIENDSDPLAQVSISEISYGIEGTYDLGKDIVARASATMGDESVSIDGSIFFLPSESTYDSWNLDAGISYYITSNARVDATIGVGGQDGTFWESDTSFFAVSGEFQPWSGRSVSRPATRARRRKISLFLHPRTKRTLSRSACGGVLAARRSGIGTTQRPSTPGTAATNTSAICANGVWIAEGRLPFSSAWKFFQRLCCCACKWGFAAC